MACDILVTKYRPRILVFPQPAFHMLLSNQPRKKIEVGRVHLLGGGSMIPQLRLFLAQMTAKSRFRRLGGSPHRTVRFCAWSDEV